MTAEIIYQGELRNELTHIFSGTKILTDAPLDNHGHAEAFSPTDLVAASAGACALTIMGIAARDRGFNIENTKVEVTKEMSSNPRKISALRLEFTFPAKNYTEEQKRLIRHIAHNCPVMLSLHPEIRKDIVFYYMDENT
ncbi:MAG: OsmC family protein [Chitinophagales bacterium]